MPTICKFVATKVADTMDGAGFVIDPFDMMSKEKLDDMVVVGSVDPVDMVVRIGIRLKGTRMSPREHQRLLKVVGDLTDILLMEEPDVEDENTAK